MHHKTLISAVGAVALAALAILPAAGTTQLALGAASPNRLETASAAIPTAANPVVMDSTQRADRITASNAKAVASSAATSNCDGCDAQSTTLQVVYFDGSNGATADNTATAWSSCVGCASSAVSVQLVVALRAQPLVANNRALALNATCAGCTTTSAAIQFVIAGDTRRELSAQARELIARVQAQLADNLAQPSPDQGQQKAQADSLAIQTAEELENVIINDLGPAVVERKVDVQVGQ
jgi:Fe-S cluster biogenesis protein NfuA